MTARTEDWTADRDAFMDHWLAVSSSGGRDTKVFVPLGFDDRVKRLFAVACCLEISHLMKDERSREAVRVAESFADGRCGQDTLQKAHTTASAASAATSAAAAYATSADAAYAAYAAATSAADAAAYAAYAAATSAADAAARKKMWAKQGLILIQFAGVGWIFDPSWADTTTTALARGIYGDKNWQVMPVLADALQEAGCEEELLLADLRHPETPWYRGAKILDCLLEKRK